MTKTQAKRTIAWPISDPHGGYRFGLMRPGVVIPPMDERERSFRPRSTAFQNVIWRHYKSDVAYVRRLAGEDDIVLILLGDLIQGTILRDGMLVTPRLSDQLYIIEDALAEVLAVPNVKHVYICKGTGAHTMRHGSAENLVAQHIRDKYELPTTVYYHVRLNIRGAEFDLAHHGSSAGIWKWIRGDQIRRYTRDIVLEDMGARVRPPDVVLRGHYHDRWIEHLHIEVEEGRLIDPWAAIVPGYSLFTDDYTMKQTKSKPRMTVGTLPVEIVDGKVRKIYDRAHKIRVYKREVFR